MKRMFALIIVALMLAIAAPQAMAFSLTTVDVDKSSYGYMNETTLTFQGPIVTQASSGNSNAALVGAPGGVAISGSEQFNHADAKICQNCGASQSNTSSTGFTGAGVLGNGVAGGSNTGLSTAQTGIVVVDVTKLGGGYHNSLDVNKLIIK